MADTFDPTGPIAGASAVGRWTSAFAKASPSLLFALRLWTAVCVALFVAFWLEPDNPFWAGTSAAIVCQPQLGASLRKGWFRMIGTAVGATMIVVLTACFPQNRIAFLVLLALWCGICAFAATVFRNFASYSAALAGYTAAIIAADNLGATGGQRFPSAPRSSAFAKWLRTLGRPRSSTPHSMTSTRTQHQSDREAASIRRPTRLYA